jgi:hypothetical protein
MHVFSDHVGRTFVFEYSTTVTRCSDSEGACRCGLWCANIRALQLFMSVALCIGFSYLCRVQCGSWFERLLQPGSAVGGNRFLSAADHVACGKSVPLMMRETNHSPDVQCCYALPTSKVGWV